jgi:hypothetical protein
LSAASNEPSVGLQTALTEAAKVIEVRMAASIEIQEIPMNLRLLTLLRGGEVLSADLY